MVKVKRNSPLRRINDNLSNVFATDRTSILMGGKRKTKKSRKSKRTKKSRKSRKSRKMKKTGKSKKVRKIYGGQPNVYPEPNREFVINVLGIMLNDPILDHNDRVFAEQFGKIGYEFTWDSRFGEYVRNKDSLGYVDSEIVDSSLDKFNRILKSKY